MFKSSKEPKYHILIIYNFINAFKVIFIVKFFHL